MITTSALVEGFKMVYAKYVWKKRYPPSSEYAISIAEEFPKVKTGWNTTIKISGMENLRKEEM